MMVAVQIELDSSTLIHQGKAGQPRLDSLQCLACPHMASWGMVCHAGTLQVLCAIHGEAVSAPCTVGKQDRYLSIAEQLVLAASPVRVPVMAWATASPSRNPKKEVALFTWIGCVSRARL